MTNITELALIAYCDQFNATGELTPAESITPSMIESRTTIIDDLTTIIDILDDECPIRILALDIDSTTDRFAIGESSIRFFLAVDAQPYIPLP